ncbi:MAG TPA: TonB-dependent receptor [Sphingobacterium bovisgrunnientis]|nr:TonB-dependent receptor [Sphingobacterium bovisgrunnientis]
MFINRILLLIFWPFLVPSILSAQSNITLRGRVTNEANHPLQFVNVFVDEAILTSQTNNQGEFSLNIPSSLKEITIRFSMVGKKGQTLIISSTNYSKPLNIQLKDLSFTLEEIHINPIQQRTRNSNSSIVFDEEAIEKTQAFSLMDIINTIPGKSTSAPNIDAPQLITLRGNQGNAYDMNNSLGVAIIMDGVNLSNDANMQTRSLSQFGMSGGILSGAKSYSGGDVPFQGIDLREIPVETIEKVEVIQGVASAQFSELTDGAIIIDRKAAETPWSLVTNVNGGSTNFSLSKGVNLPDRFGALNLGLNYAISNPDPRDKVKQYDRVNTSMMWSTQFHPHVKNTLSLDYSNRTDQVRMDPDDDTRQLSYSKNTSFRISNRFSWRSELPFARTINLTMSYSQQDQHSFKQWLLNQSPKGYAYKDTTGIYEGVVLSGRYIAEEEIIGKPITASANLNLSKNVKLSDVLHVFSYGFSTNYSNNGGRGIVADPDRPRWVNTAGQNARPYSFEYLDPLINYGFFFTDNFKLSVFNRNLISNLGFRIDQQNGSWSFQPRLSTVLKWNDKVDFTAAFGVSSKSPTMAHRYPAPTFLDIPLILAYNSDDALYLVHTEKYQADNRNLRPSKSQQLEIGMRYAHSWFNTSLNAFLKNNTDGFSTVKRYKAITLPDYTYSFDEQLKEIIYQPTGTMTSYYNYGEYSLENILNSSSYGIDWMVNTKKFEGINSSFNFSTSLIFSKENPKRNEIVILNSPITIDGQNIWHIIYPPASKNRKTNLMSKMGSTTHIPQLGFVIITNFDLYWMRKTSSPYGVKTQSAISYMTPDGKEYEIPANFENIPVRDISLQVGDLPFIYGSLNLSVAKEMKKKFRIAVTAYNVLNIQPENLQYSASDTDIFTVQRFNSPLSITGGISFKF